jgi:multidrug efflux pump subunit AcrA (membrane-fusion protein)
MFISEDGTVTGSIDVSKLDEIEPKSDEARAQHAALKAERDAGQEQAARDAERLAELSRRQNPQLRTDEERAEAEKAGLESSQRQQREAERLAAEQQKAEQQREANAAKAAKPSGKQG